MGCHGYLTSLAINTQRDAREIRGAFSHCCWGGVGGLAGLNLPPDCAHRLEALNLGRWFELCSWLLLNAQSDVARRNHLPALKTSSTAQPCALKKRTRGGRAAGHLLAGSKAQSSAHEPTARHGKQRLRLENGGTGSQTLPRSHEDPTAEGRPGCRVTRAEAAHRHCQPAGSATVRKQNLPRHQRCFIPSQEEQGLFFFY